MVVRIIYRPHASESTRSFRPRTTFSSIRVLALAAITFVYLGGQHSKEPLVEAANAAGKSNQTFSIRRGRADLSLHWDRQSALIRNGDSGHLVIRDGGAERTVFLSSEQLRYGSIFYPDATGQTSFRLFVTRSDSPVYELSLSARENQAPNPLP